MRHGHGPLGALRRHGDGAIAVLCGLALGAGEHGLGFVADDAAAAAGAAVAAGVEPDLLPRLRAGREPRERRRTARCSSTWRLRAALATSQALQAAGAPGSQTRVARAPSPAVDGQRGEGDDRRAGEERRAVEREVQRGSPVGPAPRRRPTPQAARRGRDHEARSGSARAPLRRAPTASSAATATSVHVAATR